MGTNSGRGSVMNKRLAAAAASASLLAGAAGFAIGVTGTAGAQSDPPTTTAPPRPSRTPTRGSVRRSSRCSTTAPSPGPDRRRHESAPRRPAGGQGPEGRRAARWRQGRRLVDGGDRPRRDRRRGSGRAERPVSRWPIWPRRRASTRRRSSMRCWLRSSNTKRPTSPAARTHRPNRTNRSPSNRSHHRLRQRQSAGEGHRHPQGRPAPAVARLRPRPRRAPAGQLPRSGSSQRTFNWRGPRKTVPWMRVLSRSSNVSPGSRSSSVPSAVTSSARARCAPRQKCGPMPKVMIGSGRRRDVVVVGRREHRRITIGGGDTEQHPLCRRRSSGRTIRSRSALASAPCRRPDPTAAILRRPIAVRCVGRRRPARVAGMRQQRVEHRAEPVEGRVGPRGEEQPHEREDLFVAQRVAFVIGRRQRRDEVVRRLIAALRHEWAQHVGELGLASSAPTGSLG